MAKKSVKASLTKAMKDYRATTRCSPPNFQKIRRMETYKSQLPSTTQQHSAAEETAGSHQAAAAEAREEREWDRAAAGPFVFCRMA